MAGTYGNPSDSNVYLTAVNGNDFAVLTAATAAGEPTTAPTKPITKPDTKPRTRPSHPGKNPRPGEQIDPKAGRISPEDAKQEVIDVILNLLKK